MSSVAFKRLVYMLFQLISSSPNCSINCCSDFLSGDNFFFHKLFIGVNVCLFRFSYLPRIAGRFGISTFSVLMLVYHEFGILCIRVIFLKKNTPPFFLIF